jgi:hypothetical protein
MDLLLSISMFLAAGFAYLWRSGSLDWVRSSATTTLKIDRPAGFEASGEARIDKVAWTMQRV